MSPANPTTPPRTGTSGSTPSPVKKSQNRYNSAITTKIQIIYYNPSASSGPPQVPALCSVGQQESFLPINPQFGLANIVVCSDAGIYPFDSVQYPSGVPATIKATLTDSNGNLIGGRPIAFFFDGVSYTAFTNAQGVATYVFTQFGVVPGLPPQPGPSWTESYNIIAMFFGD